MIMALFNIRLSYSLYKKETERASRELGNPLLEGQLRHINILKKWHLSHQCRTRIQIKL